MSRADPKPADAWWDPKDREWVHGAKDDEGRLVGEVRYWNADGELISTAEHRAGKPHGIARRYYRTGEIAQDSRYVDGVIHGERRYLRSADPAITNDGQLGRLPRVIATHVCSYDHGDLIGQVYYDAAGTELDSNGRPMPPRPPGIPATAFCINEQGWFWSRRRGENGEQRLESREWFMTGALRRVNDDVTGAERAYYDHGVVRYEAERNLVGTSRHLVGELRYYDRNGRLYHVEQRDPSRTTGRVVRESWHRESGSREGAVDVIEVGSWTVRDAAGVVIAEYELGTRLDDGGLIDQAVCADELDDAYQPAPNDRSLTAMLARARRAGIERDPSELDLDDGPAWRTFDDEGVEISLAHKPSTNLQIVARLEALRWGPPDAPLLAALAAALFRADRAAAALDVVDASLAVSADPDVARARTSYLRALGRADEAEASVPRPDKLDDRALELLAEIRANPDDDAPRLVLADHVATRFPEHAALIVAQCNGRPDRSLEEAFLASLPAWIRDASAIDRGFFDHIRFVQAEHFVTGDPDVLYRVSPTSTFLDLGSASDHIATLVTMPALRRYRELSFSDTYLWNTHVEQLASCPYFDELEHLSLYNCGLGDEDLETLAGSTAFPKLLGLDLTNGREGQDYTLAGVRALAGAPFARSLRSLSMQRRWLGDEVIDVVARFPALVDLDLTANRLTDVAAARDDESYRARGTAARSATRGTDTTRRHARSRRRDRTPSLSTRSGTTGLCHLLAERAGVATGVVLWVDRLRAARDVVGLGVAVCELTVLLEIEHCTLALYEQDGRPSLLVDNAPVLDRERLDYIAGGWIDDASLRELREHHAPVIREGALLLPILASGYVLGSIRCHAPRFDDLVRRDLTTLASYVSVRAAELGITAQPDPSIASLTPRQLDVAQLLAIGRTNEDIGHRLGMSTNTVKKHLKDIYTTLGVTNRTECAIRMRHDAPRNAIPLGVTHVGGVAVTRTS